MMKCRDKFKKWFFSKPPAWVIVVFESFLFAFFSAALLITYGFCLYSFFCAAFFWAVLFHYCFVHRFILICIVFEYFLHFPFL